jgi:hypothetical protein
MKLLDGGPVLRHDACRIASAHPARVEIKVMHPTNMQQHDLRPQLFVCDAQLRRHCWRSRSSPSRECASNFRTFGQQRARQSLVHRG